VSSLPKRPFCARVLPINSKIGGVKLAISHPWNLPLKEAQGLQTRLAAEVITQTTFDPAGITSVAGVDVSVRGGTARAAAILLSYPGLEPLDCGLAQQPITFPYVPGLLAFREGPAVLAALDQLSTRPDICILDAHGLAHPRRFGLASHIGVILDLVSIGCAKSVLIGEHRELGRAAGDWVDLMSGEEVIGAVLRTRQDVKPVFVSIGHRIDLVTARRFVLACTRGYRLPEPTRLAHRVAGGAMFIRQSASPRE